MKPAKRPPAAAEPTRSAPLPRSGSAVVFAPLWDAITSLKLTIACLAVLMVLVVACTLAQVHLGTWGAVEIYMRSWIVWWDVPHTNLSAPVFPGGALTGFLLLVNLIAAQLRRLELSWKKSGLWIVHLGLITLVAGEFVSAVYQRENQLTLVNGQTGNYVESPTDAELAVIDTSGAMDEVWSFPQSLLRPGAVLEVPGRQKKGVKSRPAVALRVISFAENSEIAGAPEGQGVATAGFGPKLSVQKLTRNPRDGERNRPAVVVERLGAQVDGPGGKVPETWLASSSIERHQAFEAEGRRYELVMRTRREYLPYAITLQKFSHDVYPGTDTPKNFSSLVRVSTANGESRDVLIKMNQPLRYRGKTFYQASYIGENTTVLQVVQNPGWLLPYLSCVLVALGLLVHFGIALARWVRAQPAATAAGSSEAST